MDKVYKGCMLVDEQELKWMKHAVFNELIEYEYECKDFENLAKLYVKLLEEKESISRERAKHESQTETESI